MAGDANTPRRHERRHIRPGYAVALVLIGLIAVAAGVHHSHTLAIVGGLFIAVSGAHLLHTYR